MKTVAVLGSTGSIGRSTLKVLEQLTDRFKVGAISAFGNVSSLARQIKRFKPKAVAVVDSKKASLLKKKVGLSGLKVFSTQVGLEMLAESPEIDIVVIAIPGSIALSPLIAAIKAKKKICLANKEALVMAGSIIMRLARKYGAQIIPVDSEHSAIFQCIKQARSASSVNRIYLTGSGGPLRNVPKSRFRSVNISEVLRHPKWNMGPKITVDSASLMNKGLEIIEAKHLFGISANRIKVLIHPEAIIHSMVEFTDGTILAQMSVTDMKLPIQYALCYPQRSDFSIANLDFKKAKQLNFHEPDINRFPCLSLANAAAKLGGTYPAVLNAANEEAVCAYLQKRIKFTDIPKIIEKALLKHKFTAEPLLADVLNADSWAREEARGLIG